MSSLLLILCIPLCLLQLKSKQDTYFAVELSEDPDEFRLECIGLYWAILSVSITASILASLYTTCQSILLAETSVLLKWSVHMFWQCT